MCNFFKNLGSIFNLKKLRGQIANENSRRMILNFHDEGELIAISLTYVYIKKEKERKI